MTPRMRSNCPECGMTGRHVTSTTTLMGFFNCPDPNITTHYWRCENDHSWGTKERYGKPYDAAVRQSDVDFMLSMVDRMESR